jgi:hypothetical protein
MGHHAVDADQRVGNVRPDVDLKQISLRSLPEGHLQVTESRPRRDFVARFRRQRLLCLPVASSEIPRFEDIRQHLMVEVQSNKQRRKMISSITGAQ